MESSFPHTHVQLCIVQNIRQSRRYVVWKERRAVARDLRVISRASVKTEVGCPPITDVRCPLFADAIVRSSCSGRGIDNSLLSGRDGPPTQES
ncbi:MAG: hypothetical protein CV081_12660, partial [Nitrospira sp. LK265]|nr:hypothetical protein [Nitrospira sp. LK265]